MTIRVAEQPGFKRWVETLPPDRKRAAYRAVLKFIAEPSLPGLRLRPLKGRKDHFIISSAHGDRIILRKDADDRYSALDVGPHDNVYRRWDR